MQDIEKRYGVTIKARLSRPDGNKHTLLLDHMPAVNIAVVKHQDGKASLLRKILQ